MKTYLKTALFNAVFILALPIYLSDFLNQIGIAGFPLWVLMVSLLESKWSMGDRFRFSVQTALFSVWSFIWNWVLFACAAAMMILSVHPVITIINVIILIGLLSLIETILDYHFLKMGGSD